jgi:propionyl-CoA synthetase
VQKYTYK